MRYEAMTVELSITREDPWRVWDHDLGRCVQNVKGETIRLWTEDEAVRLANVMNRSVAKV